MMLHNHLQGIITLPLTQSTQRMQKKLPSTNFAKSFNLSEPPYLYLENSKKLK